MVDVKINYDKLEKIRVSFRGIVESGVDDDILENYIKVSDNYNSFIDSIDNVQKNVTENFSKQLNKAVETVGVHGEFDLNDVFEDTAFKDATKDDLAGKSLDAIVEEMNSNQESLADEVKITIEQEFIKGLASA